MSVDPRDSLNAIQPEVARPRDALPMPVMLGILALLAVGLFVFLDAHRRSLAKPVVAEKQAMLQAAPPLALPPAPPPPEPVVLREVVRVNVPQPVPYTPPVVRGPAPALVGEEPVRPAPPKTANRDAALVIDLTNGAGATGGRSGEGAAVASNDDAARATLIRSRSSVIPQGAIVGAVLETPLNSDRPGLARAMVSQDVRGFDGSRVLIPRGSRLVGEFRADNAAGKRRVLVTWNRLIRPDGVAIRIASPATDAMGGAGIAGAVNTHFAERFASAVLQSALTIGVNVASSELGRSGNGVYVGIPGQFSSLGGQIVPNANRPATVKVKEGAEIAVLVARDLDFSGTPAVK